MKQMMKKYDKWLAVVFAFLTFLFLLLFLTNDAFFNWAFQRHHNILSWYIRPLWIVPIIYFALKKSSAGIALSVFCLFTSMFWFPTPAVNDVNVLKFLAYEMNYIRGDWDLQKTLFTLTIPLFFFLLIAAAWQRRWNLLLYTVLGTAFLKIIWSAVFSGQSGLSILKPAILGLIFCLLMIVFLRKKKRHKDTDGKP